MPERDPIWNEAAPVFHWLGLGHAEPSGLHGHNRKRLTLRHTRSGEAQEQGIWLDKALVRAYPANREARIMTLLRPQRLDDDLWRMVYALMVTGGPLRLYDLVRSLARLVSDDRKVADAEAVRLYQAWSREVAHG